MHLSRETERPFTTECVVFPRIPRQYFHLDQRARNAARDDRWTYLGGHQAHHRYPSDAPQEVRVDATMRSQESESNACSRRSAADVIAAFRVGCVRRALGEEQALPTFLGEQF